MLFLMLKSGNGSRKCCEKKLELELELQWAISEKIQTGDQGHGTSRDIEEVVCGNSRD